jgi:hypothetical protein
MNDVDVSCNEQSMEFEADGKANDTWCKDDQFREQWAKGDLATFLQCREV